MVGPFVISSPVITHDQREVIVVLSAGHLLPHTRGLAGSVLMMTALQISNRVTCWE
jgi:hypothetical protein